MPDPRSTTQNGLSEVPVSTVPSQSGAWKPTVVRLEQMAVTPPVSVQSGSAAVLMAYAVPQRLAPVPEMRG